MTSLIIDDALLLRLKDAVGLTEVVGSDGRVVGFFAPVTAERSKEYAEAAARFDLSEIKLRKEADQKGITTKELFEHLQSVTEDKETREYLQAKIGIIAERDKCDLR